MGPGVRKRQRDQSLHGNADLKVRPGLIFLTFLCGLAPHASAQLSATPIPVDSTMKNSVGLGASYGVFLERDADFWGLAVDYGRVIGSRWAGGASLGFDQETDHSRAEEQSTDTLNAIVTVSYRIGSVNVITGLSKGFADTDNPDRTMDWSDGDWGTGLVIAYSIPGLLPSDRWVASISVGYEYNLTDPEADLSFDAGVGYLF